MTLSLSNSRESNDITNSTSTNAQKTNALNELNLNGYTLKCRWANLTKNLAKKYWIAFIFIHLNHVQDQLHSNSKILNGEIPKVAA